MTDYRVWYCADPDALSSTPTLRACPGLEKQALGPVECRGPGPAGDPDTGSNAWFDVECGEIADLLVHYRDLPWLFVLAAVPFFPVHDGAAMGTIRTGRRLKRDGTLPHTGPWRKNRRRTALLVGGTWIFLVMLVLAVLLPKVTARSIDLDALGEPLPCVSLSALDAAAGAGGRTPSRSKSTSWRRMCRSWNPPGRSG